LMGSVCWPNHGEIPQLNFEICEDCANLSYFAKRTTGKEKLCDRRLGAHR
jgi:hypothetical protein